MRHASLVRAEPMPLERSARAELLFYLPFKREADYCQGVDVERPLPLGAPRHTVIARLRVSLSSPIGKEMMMISLVERKVAESPGEASIFPISLQQPARCVQKAAATRARHASSQEADEAGREPSSVRAIS